MQTVTTFVIICSVAPLLGQAVVTSRISVCEAVERRLELNQKMVEVRGVVWGGEHGAWLKSLADCKYKLVTRTVEWPNVIYLRYPDRNSRNEADHASFDVDLLSIRKSEDTLRRLGFNPTSDRVVKTFLGLLVTYPDLDKRVSPGIAGAPKLGFGPAGLEAPVQLLVKSVGDVSIYPSSP